jgi:hypothetical protein
MKGQLTLKHRVHRAKRRLAAAVQGSSLTLSGELLIERQGMHSIDNADLDAMGIMEELAPLGEWFPGLRIKMVNGLCDVTIKLFLYEGSIYQADFYSAVEEVLTRCAEKVYAQTSYTLRLNVTGTIHSLGKGESFRFLNKESLVSHKIFDKEQDFCPLKKWRGKLAGRIMR